MTTMETTTMSEPSEAMRLLMGLTMPDGRRFGEVAIDVQIADAKAILDPVAGGAAFHFITRPRGMSKTSDLAGMLLAILLTQQAPGTTSYGAAADQDQAALLIDSVAGFIERTPGLAGAVKITGRKVTATRTGATFEALAADLASSWGLRPAFLVVDEVAQHATGARAQRFFEALHSATGKEAARMVLLTSPGDDAHWSYRVLEHARQSPAWRTSETLGPVPWVDPAWLDEQRALLPAWMFTRLHEGRWVGADDRLTSIDALRACVTLDGPLPPDPRHDYVIALDIGLKNDRTVAAVCHMETLSGARRALGAHRPPSERERVLSAMGALDLRPSGFEVDERSDEVEPVRVVLDRMEVWQGSQKAPVRLAEVEAWLLQAHRSFGAPLVFDPYQAAGLSQRLNERGVTTHEFVFSSASTGRLAAVLHQLLRDGALALPDDPDLLEELSNVRLVERTPGVVRLDHDPGRHDDRAVTLAMAAAFLLSEAPRHQPVLEWNYSVLRRSRR